MIQDVSTESLCHLANIVLEKCFFDFGEKKFKQKLGTAVGTKFAPLHENFFIACLEKDFSKTHLTNLIYGYNILITSLQYGQELLMNWKHSLNISTNTIQPLSK